MSNSSKVGTFSASLQTIAAINNDGVRLFEHGKLEESMDMFQISLDEITELHAKLNEKGRSEVAVSPVPCKAKTQSPISGWSMHAPMTYLPEENRATVFSRTLFLREVALFRVSPRDEEVMLVVDILLSAILFNKGVSRHAMILKNRKLLHDSTVTTAAKHAMHPCEPMFSSQESAQGEVFQCYNRSLQALQRLGHRVRQEDRTSLVFFDLDVLTLGLFNNMGVLFCDDLARFREAEECFRAVQGLFCRVDKKHLELTLSETEISAVGRNILLVPLCSSPAA